MRSFTTWAPPITRVATASTVHAVGEPTASAHTGWQPRPAAPPGGLARRHRRSPWRSRERRRRVQGHSSHAARTTQPVARGLRHVHRRHRDAPHPTRARCITRRAAPTLVGTGQRPPCGRISVMANGRTESAIRLRSGTERTRRETIYTPRATSTTAAAFPTCSQTRRIAGPITRSSRTRNRLLEPQSLQIAHS
jgi:hypothetical protein